MPSLLSTRLAVDRMLLRSTFEAGRSVMAPTSHSAVVPAKAGTHNHWISLLQRSSAACGLSMDSAVWVPAFAGTTDGQQGDQSLCQPHIPLSSRASEHRERDPGSITTGVRCRTDRLLHVAYRWIPRYGSPLSRGRRMDSREISHCASLISRCRPGQASIASATRDP